MFERAMGHMYKQWLMWKRSPADMALVIVYPLVTMLSIGLFAAFVIGPGSTANSLIFVFAGIVIWDFYDISQRAVTYGITYEIWADSLKHFFSTPSTEKDFILGNSFFGLMSSFLSLLMVGVMGFLIFGFNIFSAGAYLILACLSIFAFGTAIGLVIDYFMVTKDLKYMSLIWIATGIIMIFSGVYYPVTILPEPARIISYALPSTHAIQAIRSTLVSDYAAANISIALSFATTAVYFLIGYVSFVRGVKKGKVLGKIARY
jgi:ABC-2 type transport system permease protein